MPAINESIFTWNLSWYLFLNFSNSFLLVHFQSWISEHFQNILHSFFWTISYAFEGERTRTCSTYSVRFSFSCSLKWTWSVPSPFLLAVLFPKHCIHESRKYYSAIYGRLDSEILKSKMLLSNVIGVNYWTLISLALSKQWEFSVSILKLNVKMAPEMSGFIN